MATSSTVASSAQLIESAKASMQAYNEKNWDAVKAKVTPDFVYDEVATGRKVQGADQSIAIWQGWATAFPDSKATFNNALANGNTVVLEVTWQGTHKGPLQSPRGPIAATGKRIEMRACNVMEMAGDKVKLQRQYFDLTTMMQQLGLAD